ncbi:transcription initiation factor TFIID subunit 8-like isoform X1 [Schistocerca piceifrons]|uniref:transcription initiation factor TFIID subunit 8-like isoform X1 n=2 Tax=Schistocerca piceifrons TaxID=274613 RepID=UPI001F5FB745|nr:transcription initiation factor TFIID subunit 8-like isoform X1 [Schistocerca piceifrons]
MFVVNRQMSSMDSHHHGPMQAVQQPQGGAGSLATQAQLQQQQQAQQQQAQLPWEARRRALHAAVCCLLAELGTEAADRAALESLVEAVQSFVWEVGNSSRAYCELAGRTQPLLGDVVVALVNIGFPLEGLEAHARRPGRSVLSPPTHASQHKSLSILQAGVKLPHPAHVPTHLPAFPDPHAYIRTPTHKQPVTEYEAIREKAATQKRDVERALTRFVAKTSETHSLFVGVEDGHVFPLIACKPHHPPYLKALLPSDQVFEFDEELSSPPQRPPRQRREADGEEEGDEETREGDDAARAGDADTIDNPYLRPVKLPRRKKPVASTPAPAKA